MLLIEAADRLPPVVGGDDPVPGAAEDRPDHADHRRLVVGDEDLERLDTAGGRPDAEEPPVAVPADGGAPNEPVAAVVTRSG